MSYTDDSELPEVTDERLEEALKTTKAYTIVVLMAGRRFSVPSPDRDPDVGKTIWSHGKRNFALREAGLMPMVPGRGRQRRHRFRHLRCHPRRRGRDHVS
jgi:hypothetical protein